MKQDCAPINPTDLEHVARAVGTRWEKFRQKRIFITGGTGFVGKWLLESLLHANQERHLQCEVTILSRDPDRFQRDYPHLARSEGVSMHRGDVRDFQGLNGTFDVLIHGATDVATHDTALNILDTCLRGTRHTLEFAKRHGVQDVLLISSGAIYGRQPPELDVLPETWLGAPDPLAPNAAYGTGKRTAECLAVQTGKAESIRIKIARCFAFVGPHLPMDKHFAVGNFIRDAMKGKPITLQGDGTPLRTYLYAADLAAWLWVILVDGVDGVAYNVGGDEVVSIAELANAVNLALQTDVPIVCSTPASLQKLPERYVPDIAKARRELHLAPHISLADAIRRTASWANTRVPV